MQQKLRSVFRRSSKSSGSGSQHEQLEKNTRSVKASTTRSGRQRESSNGIGRASVDSSTTGFVYTGRSRPVSSIYDEPQLRAPTGPKGGDLSSSTDPAIASDYKAYLPVLSPVSDDLGDNYLTPSTTKQQIVGRSEASHEEDVADRNIARYNRSPNIGHHEVPGPDGRQHSHNTSVGAGSVRSTLAPAQADGSVWKHSVGQDVAEKGHLYGNTLAHTGTIANTSGSQKRLSACTNPSEVESKEPIMSGNRQDTSRPPQGKHAFQSDLHQGGSDKIDDRETPLARKLREEGVVDLRNTVDTDGDITWVPAVTHEVIKPHQHEIVQHKIYREIHNYEHFHRIQPVMMTEVLPPRHWIPNPNGEGLIEISADELPARTGENRWWSICEHSSPYSNQATVRKYRTEPEIIEAGTFMTAEGFERKETIIIHPPTLADLTGYGGPVQAMHFDHKTGKSWMGELTTMDKLQQLQQELDRAPEVQAFSMDGLAKSLPNVDATPTRRGSTSITRKPVNGHTSTVHGSNIGRKITAA